MRSLLAIAGVVLAGAAGAALDALNDEGWNPAMFGSPFVALALPLGLSFALPEGGEKRGVVLMAASVGALFGTILVAALGGAFLQWAAARAWAVMW